MPTVSLRQRLKNLEVWCGKENVTREPSNLPEVGDQIFYIARGSLDGVYKPVKRCAFVSATSVEDPALKDMIIHAVVLNPEGQFFNKFVPYDPDGRPGTWKYK